MHKKVMIGINTGHIRKNAQTATINVHTTSPRINANIILSIALIISHILLYLFPYRFSKNDFTFALLLALSQPA